jgi:hypothetical protein
MKRSRPGHCLRPSSWNIISSLLYLTKRTLGGTVRIQEVNTFDE